MKIQNKALARLFCGLAMAGLANPSLAKDLIVKKTSNWSKLFTLVVQIGKGKSITVDYRQGSFSAIDENGKKTLLLDGLERLDVLNEKVVVSIGDMNFDGYKDVAIDVSQGYGGVNIFTSIFFWDETKNRFTKKGFEASNIELDEKSKLLISSQRSGPRWYRSDYKFDGLKPWKYHEQVGPGIVEIHTYFNPAGKLIKKIVSDTITPTQTPQPAVFTVKLDRVYLYSKPDENTKTASYIIKGDRVTVIDEAGAWTQWLKVRYEGKKTIVRWVRAQDFEQE